MQRGSGRAQTATSFVKEWSRTCGSSEEGTRRETSESQLKAKNVRSFVLTFKRLPGRVSKSLPPLEVLRAESSRGTKDSDLGGFFGEMSYRSGTTAGTGSKKRRQCRRRWRDSDRRTPVRRGPVVSSNKGVGPTDRREADPEVGKRFGRWRVGRGGRGRGKTRRGRPFSLERYNSNLRQGIFTEDLKVRHSWNVCRRSLRDPYVPPHSGLG